MAALKLVVSHGRFPCFVFYIYIFRFKNLPETIKCKMRKLILIRLSQKHSQLYCLGFEIFVADAQSDRYWKSREKNFASTNVLQKESADGFAHSSIQPKNIIESHLTPRRLKSMNSPSFAQRSSPSSGTTSLRATHSKRIVEPDKNLLQISYGELKNCNSER